MSNSIVVGGMHNTTVAIGHPFQQSVLSAAPNLHRNMENFNTLNMPDEPRQYPFGGLKSTESLSLR
jgi:hypothetical protein